MSPGQKLRFKHLEPLCYSQSLGTFKKERKDSESESPLFMSFASKYPAQAKVIRDSRKHKEVGFSYERMRIQEDKMDAPNVYPDKEVDLFITLAEDFAYTMYRPAFEANLVYDITHVGTTAPGYPYTRCGIQTKKAAVESELHRRLLELRPDPIWKSSPKSTEALPEEDLSEGKLRTFAQVPTYFSTWQKHYFEDQNERMAKMFTRTWGKYGYVKQYGGFNSLMKKLQKYPIVFMGDVSGWDRKVSLDAVYRLRTRGLKCNPSFHESEVYDWVVQNTIRPKIAFGDGTIWRRKTGNNSGSSNTTTDNTIAHTIIMFYFVIRRWHKIFGSLPSYEEVLGVADFFLFGDDNAGGISEVLCFDSQEELYSDLSSAYAAFGLLLKQKAVKVIFKQSGEPFSGIEFLGSTCRFEHGLYVPYPRLSKLMFSVSCIYTGDVEDFGILIDRVKAIWDLVSFTQLEEVKESVSCLASFLFSYICQQQPTFSPTKLSELDLARQKRIDWTLYLGSESGSLNFSAGQVEGGINSDLNERNGFKRRPKKGAASH